ncbi:MAG: ABC transporter substrate-binding protein [Clostridiales bacterium]|jgi:polar amino acid transport system substrate-binding protein|nr:ABC transporter substrate-binding protein [Clostridiales bacterium]
MKKTHRNTVCAKSAEKRKTTGSGLALAARAGRAGHARFAGKALCLALIFAMCFLAAACESGGAGGGAPGNATGGAGGESPAAGLTITEGVLKVGMEIGYPPMEYLEEDGVTPTGFDVEVAGALAASLKLDVELIDTAWDGIFSSLDSNRYDIIISSVSINDDRQAAYNLTKPYIANNLVLVTKSGSGIESPDMLAGKKAATQTETTADEYIRARQDEGLELGEYFVYDKIIQCFDELTLDRIDAVLVDSVVAAFYMGDNSDALEIVWESDEAEPLGLCLKKGNDALTALIETAVDGLYADGTMKTLAQKYFGRDITEGVR